MGYRFLSLKVFIVFNCFEVEAANDVSYQVCMRALFISQ